MLLAVCLNGHTREPDAMCLHPSLYSFFFTYPYQGHRGTGVYPSCYMMRGRFHSSGIRHLLHVGVNLLSMCWAMFIFHIWCLKQQLLCFISNAQTTKHNKTTEWDQSAPLVNHVTVFCRELQRRNTSCFPIFVYTLVLWF